MREKLNRELYLTRDPSVCVRPGTKLLKGESFSLMCTLDYESPRWMSLDLDVYLPADFLDFVELMKQELIEAGCSPPDDLFRVAYTVTPPSREFGLANASHRCVDNNADDPEVQALIVYSDDFEPGQKLHMPLDEGDQDTSLTRMLSYVEYILEEIQDDRTAIGLLSDDRPFARETALCGRFYALAYLAKKTSLPRVEFESIAKQLPEHEKVNQCAIDIFAERYL